MQGQQDDKKKKNTCVAIFRLQMNKGKIFVPDTGTFYLCETLSFYTLCNEHYAVNDDKLESQT